MFVGSSAGDVFRVPLDALPDLASLSPSRRRALHASKLRFPGLLLSVDDGSAVLMVRFVHLGVLLDEPTIAATSFSESDFLAPDSVYAVFARKLQLCATIGELDSVAAEIKVSPRMACFVLTASACEGCRPDWRRGPVRAAAPVRREEVAHRSLTVVACLLMSASRICQEHPPRMQLLWQRAHCTPSMCAALRHAHPLIARQVQVFVGSSTGVRRYRIKDNIRLKGSYASAGQLNRVSVVHIDGTLRAVMGVVPTTAQARRQYTR